MVFRLYAVIRIFLLGELCVCLNQRRLVEQILSLISFKSLHLPPDISRLTPFAVARVKIEGMR